MSVGLLVCPVHVTSAPSTDLHEFLGTSSGGGRKKPITIIKIGKSKIGKKRNLGKFQNQEISKPSPNNGANERPKGDFKASVPTKIRIFKYQNYSSYTILQPQK